MSPKTRLVLDSKSASWKAHLGQWQTFAAVGGASLAAATNADAGIVYSAPVNLTVSVPTTKSHATARKYFSIGGYKEQLFAFFGNNPRRGTVGLGSVSSSHRVGFALNASGLAKKYAFGNPIHVLNSYYFPQVQRQDMRTGKIRGSFGPGTVTGFVGFRASNGDLGWIQLRVSDRGSSGYPNEETLINWAYNNVPGGAIVAGQTPEPSSLALGLLAAGAVGLAALRAARARANVAE
jgi:hypothetical protein